MNAVQNTEILSKILTGISNDNLGDVMYNLGYELTKNSEKSMEWSLPENEESSVNSLVSPIHMMVYYNTQPSVRVIQFPGNYTDNDFRKFIRDNDDVVSIETPKTVEPRKVYK